MVTVYDPNAEDGKGAIQVLLGKESVTLPLKKGQNGGSKIRPLRAVYPGGRRANGENLSR